jgi:hypothetical protein
MARTARIIEGLTCHISGSERAGGLGKMPAYFYHKSE